MTTEVVTRCPRSADPERLIPLACYTRKPFEKELARMKGAA